jgi:heme/copper-type cytochrome/quinol oxidase subunit 2
MANITLGMVVVVVVVMMMIIIIIIMMRRRRKTLCSPYVHMSKFGLISVKTI